MRRYCNLPSLHFIAVGTKNPYHVKCLVIFNFCVLNYKILVKRAQRSTFWRSHTLTIYMNEENSIEWKASLTLKYLFQAHSLTNSFTHSFMHSLTHSINHNSISASHGTRSLSPSLPLPSLPLSVPPSLHPSLPLSIHPSLSPSLTHTPARLYICSRCSVPFR